MLIKVFILIIAAGVIGGAISLYPQLHLGGQLPPKVRIHNLSFYEANEDLRGYLDLPCGFHTINADVLKKTFHQGQVYSNLKLLLEVSETEEKAELIPVSGEEAVWFEGMQLLSPVTIREGQAVRIRTEQNHYVVLQFTFH